MTINRRKFVAAGLSALAGSGLYQPAQASAMTPQDVIHAWYGLSLELVRHTPTYSPPVASRAFAYLGITAYEAVAGGAGALRSLAGQLNGLTPLPQRVPGLATGEAAVLHAALTAAATDLFANTGPTGQRALSRLGEKLSAAVSAGLTAEIVTRSAAHGRAVAAHILAWSRSDGGAVIENLGFPASYQLSHGPAHWMPANLIALQQTPLLPDWGHNRSFAMPDGAACPLPAPPAYSEDEASAFYRQALEVVEIQKNLSLEQRAIARFWSDDPMLSPTPPGHWESIALQSLKRNDASLEQSVDVLARLGVALADAFIACWNAKYQYDLLRPVTYIRRVIDPQWQSLIATPPFPEYPSGHSTQSGAAAVVLAEAFGETYAFEDATHRKDVLAPRAFKSFWAAAEEAGISRLYGGIHFRAAIERGLDQGRCVGGFANALRTRV